MLDSRSDVGAGPLSWSTCRMPKYLPSDRTFRFSLQGQASRVAPRSRRVRPRAQRWHAPGSATKSCRHWPQHLPRPGVSRLDGTSSPSFDHGFHQLLAGCSGLESMTHHSQCMLLFMESWMICCLKVAVGLLSCHRPKIRKALFSLSTSQAVQREFRTAMPMETGML